MLRDVEEPRNELLLAGRRELDCVCDVSQSTKGWGVSARGDRVEVIFTFEGYGGRGSGRGRERGRARDMYITNIICIERECKNGRVDECERG